MTDATSQHVPSGLRHSIAAIAGERATRRAAARVSGALDDALERAKDRVAALIGLPMLFPDERRR